MRILNNITNRLTAETMRIRPDRLKHLPNGKLLPRHFFAEVFNHRGLYPQVISALKKEGLVDPFEITPEVKAHADFHIAKLQEEIGRAPFEVEIAIRLMQSVIPAYHSFIFNDVEYNGLTQSETGLSIDYNDMPDSPLRMRYGEILPSHLLAAEKRVREASCENISLLLTVLLRAAGITAYVRKDENYVGKRHYFVIAILDNKRYKLDAVRQKLQFKPTQRKESADSEILSAYYALSGNNSAHQLNFSRATEATYLSIIINPNNLLAWINFPLCNIDAKSLIAAALEHLPQNPYVWSKIGDMFLYHYNKPKEAIDFYNMSLEFPNHSLPQQVLRLAAVA